MKRYRRSRKDYPIGVIGIYDNNGKSMDRYTVCYTPIESQGETWWPYLGMSEHPYHPQGFGQHGELRFRKTRQRGERCINFAELPPDCQKLVMSDLKGATLCT